VVQVDVGVYDRNRATPILGLSCDDFDLNDGGQAAELISCKPITALDVILVADELSLRLVPGRAFQQDLKRGLSNWRKADRVALLSLIYGDLRWLYDFTNSPKPILDILNGAKTRPRIQSLNQPIFDAISEAAQKLRGSVADVRAILVLSNDRERRSQAKPDSAAEDALKANASIYQIILNNIGGSVGVVGLPWPLPRPEIRGQVPVPPPSPAMTRIVLRSGGEQLATAVLQNAFSTMIELLRGRYILSYRRPLRKQGDYHAISVRLSTSAERKHPNAIVRVRAGYYTPG